MGHNPAVGSAIARRKRIQSGNLLGRIDREVLVRHSAFRRRQPHHLQGVEVEEPTEQQVILQPLAELPLRPDRIQCRQHFGQQPRDHPNRMSRRDHRLHVQQIRHTHWFLLFSTLADSTHCPFQCSIRAGFFNSLIERACHKKYGTHSRF